MATVSPCSTHRYSVFSHFDDLDSRAAQQREIFGIGCEDGHRRQRASRDGGEYRVYRVLVTVKLVGSEEFGGGIADEPGDFMKIQSRQSPRDSRLIQAAVFCFQPCHRRCTDSNAFLPSGFYEDSDVSVAMVELGQSFTVEQEATGHQAATPGASLS